MTKVDFLNQLEKELQGNISSTLIKENIEYYKSYFTEEMNNGKSEDEILQILGDPWVIAQTIIDMNSKERSNAVYEDADRTGSRDSSREKQYQNNGKIHVFGLDTWWKKLLLVLFIIMIVMVIVTVATGIVRLFAPIAVPALVVIIILRLFNRKT